MKKVILFGLAFCISTVTLFGQKIPAMGMKYQAVLRDVSGQVIADRDVSLRIRLLAGDENGKETYSEFHHVTTTNLGLIALNIGEGKVLAGDFSKIPWSQYNIWMELGLDEQGGNDFIVISASKLLAVPYAFHAGTADVLAGGGSGEEKAAAYWKTNGNDGSFPGFHFLGTIDNQDLVVKTANQERMRIYATGDVAINNTLNIGDDLNVADDASIGGDLTINGALSVFDLTVLHDAGVGNDLTVGNDAAVSDDLSVGGDAEIEGSTSVGADLMVANDATINNHLTVNGDAEVTGSADVGTDLGVANDATINNNLNVGGDSDVTGKADVGTDLSVGNDASVTNDLNVGGDVDVTGKADVGTDLSVGNDATVTNDLNVGGDADVTR